MKKTACIYTSNTGVGLISDVNLIQDLLYEKYEIDIIYLELAELNGNIPVFGNYDIGIFIQDFSLQWLDRNKINILIANEEWIDNYKLLQLKYFNKIITKSSLSKQLLSPYNNNIVTTGFISFDKNIQNVKPSKTFLHLAGRSSQKGTESVLRSFSKKPKLSLTYLKSDDNIQEPIPYNTKHIKTFVTSEQIATILNDHSIHLCTSIYEGWGHYLYEGMSTGALIYATKLPVFLEWLDPDLVVFIDCMFHATDEETHFLKYRNNFWPYQIGWKVVQEQLDDAIDCYQKHLEKHKPRDVQAFVQHLNQENSKKLFKELTNV